MFDVAARRTESWPLAYRAFRAFLHVANLLRRSLKIRSSSVNTSSLLQMLLHHLNFQQFRNKFGGAGRSLKVSVINRARGAVASAAFLSRVTVPGPPFCPNDQPIAETVGPDIARSPGDHDKPLANRLHTIMKRICI
ncbi:hypothetical protein J6590_038536 [Homalodisca vitripennis]|nr:hypothetical protein J6590_038536 [Homalodisca vitripennis]